MLALAESRFALAALERLPADPQAADMLRKLLRTASEPSARPGKALDPRVADVAQGVSFVLEHAQDARKPRANLNGCRQRASMRAIFARRQRAGIGHQQRLSVRGSVCRLRLSSGERARRLSIQRGTRPLRFEPRTPGRHGPGRDGRSDA